MMGGYGRSPDRELLTIPRNTRCLFTLLWSKFSTTEEITVKCFDRSLRSGGGKRGMSGEGI